MKPEPMPWLGGIRSGPGWGIWNLRKNCDSGSSPSPCPLNPDSFDTFSLTLTLTTAAPFSATRPEKSGSPVTRPGAVFVAGAAATTGAPAGPAPAPACECCCATTITKMPATAASDQVLMLPIEVRPLGKKGSRIKLTDPDAGVLVAIFQA